MNAYRIREKLIDQYVKRETNKKMKISLIAFLVFFVLMFLFTYSYGVHGILMFPLGIFFLIILGVIYAASFSQLSNLIAVTYFVFSDESISIILDQEKLTMMNQVGLARNERKYGAKYNQTIRISEIESTTISADEIIIKAKNYDFFTYNGRIAIPKELIHYELIKAKILKNPDKYNLLPSSKGKN